MWVERISDVEGRQYALVHSPDTDGRCPFCREVWTAPHTHPLFGPGGLEWLQKT